MLKMKRERDRGGKKAQAVQSVILDEFQSEHV